MPEPFDQTQHTHDQRWSASAVPSNANMRTHSQVMQTPAAACTHPYSNPRAPALSNMYTETRCNPLCSFLATLYPPHEQGLELPMHLASQEALKGELVLFDG